MNRAIAFLGLTLLCLGCGSSSKPEAASTGKPANDEAKACIADYLGECGWKNVEMVALADQAKLPAAIPTPDSEAWAFTFSARYTDIFGEQRATENWTAIVRRTEGKVQVKSCFDHNHKQVAGHSGSEFADKGTLTPAPAEPELPAIVAPK